MTVGSPYAPPFEIAVTAYMPESGTYAPPALGLVCPSKVSVPTSKAPRAASPGGEGPRY
jgi:hypothetical protein